MQRLFARLPAAILLVSLSGGCASTPPRSDLRQVFEESTGSNITYVRKPGAFMSEQPGLASSGRDYVYVAPLVVNRGGERSCWLWFGVWSTVDRQARNEDASPLRLGPFQIVVDGEPMDMEPQPAETHPTGIRQVLYETPVPPTQELLVPVTRSQLQRLGSARVLTLIDHPPDGAARLWRSDDRAAAVLRHVADEIGAARTDPAPVASR
jgi:hypothetical protein